MEGLTNEEGNGGVEVGAVKGQRPTSPPSRPSSPPPDCAICLGQCRNKSFTDSCLHQFCFECLVTWSKIKPECPLCKQAFKAIIYNVKSNHQYDEYLVQQQQQPHVEDFLEVDYFEAPRFRYRTTLTLHRQEGLALERLLMHYPMLPIPNLSSVVTPSALRPPPAPRRRRTGQFRQSVYRHNLWACPLPDVTGRHRECSPEFYRQNPAQIHRLVPWLNRELSFLMSDSAQIIARILDLLPLYSIQSIAFKQTILPFLGSYTDHFLHELYSFASSPFDMIGYDCAVQYQPGGHRVMSNDSELISSDGENSNDSDIVMVSTSGDTSTNFPMPFSTTPPPEPSVSNRRLGSLSNSVIAIESMLHSDSDDSSDEVVMVGYIKPPHERTPEVVDLMASDSDTVIIEEPRISSPIEVVDEHSTPSSSNMPSTSSGTSHTTNDRPSSSSGLVKLSLKRNRVPHAVPDSDSEDDVKVVPKRSKRVKNKHKKLRFTSRDSASTECTDRDTDISDSDYAVSNNFNCSDDSENESNTENENRILRFNKSKQLLASVILQKLKNNSKTDSNGNISSSVDNDSENNYTYNNYYNEPSTSQGGGSDISNYNRKKSHKKSKHKKHSSPQDSDDSSNCAANQKLDSKGRSKSKERLINKIFDNKQTKNSNGKVIDVNKAKAKNKLFIKSSNRNKDSQVASTSRSNPCAILASIQSSSEALRRQEAEADMDRISQDYERQTGNSLLDIVSMSILAPNNPVLSINSENSQTSTYGECQNAAVSSILNHLELDDSFFLCHDSSDLRPLNLSARRENDSD